MNRAQLTILKSQDKTKLMLAFSDPVTDETARRMMDAVNKWWEGEETSSFLSMVSELAVMWVNLDTGEITTGNPSEPPWNLPVSPNP